MIQKYCSIQCKGAAVSERDRFLCNDHRATGTDTLTFHAKAHNHPLQLDRIHALETLSIHSTEPH